MATWSGIRKKLETDYLAPSLRGHLQYYATSYSRSPDHEGRAAYAMTAGRSSGGAIGTTGARPPSFPGMKNGKPV